MDTHIEAFNNRYKSVIVYNQSHQFMRYMVLYRLLITHKYIRSHDDAHDGS